MPFGNQFRCLLAIVIIKCVRVPWRITEVMLKKQFPLKDHYVIMMIFRRLAPRFPVTISYPNPLLEDDTRVILDLDLCKNGDQIYFRMKNNFDTDSINAVGIAMKDSDAFLDIGSHLGMYALPVAQAFPCCQVTAIEPLPGNFAQLERNIELNRLSNVISVNSAVTEAGGPVKFYTNPLNEGAGSILNSPIYRTGAVEVDAAEYRKNHPKFTAVLEVETCRLDDFCHGPTVVKIDVEGAEVTVLNSGRRSLEEGKIDVMVVEVTSDSIREVISILEEFKFDCFFPGQATPTKDGSELTLKVANLICLRRGSNSYSTVMSRIGSCQSKIG